MSLRYEYRRAMDASDTALALTGELSHGLSRPRQADTPALAALMLSAYRGTADSSDETEDDALREIQNYFGAPALPALPECSWVLWHAGAPLGACLCSWWERRGTPLIAYVMTDPAWKGRGLGAQLVRHSLADLAQAGYPEVRAVITAGNTPSERLFTRLGFARLPSER
jgi:RimJ/RimL family protein N-acetyltransferase